MLFADMLAAFMEDHGIHEAVHLVLVEVVEGFIAGDLRHLADSCDVGLCVILGGGSPCSNDLGDGCAVVVAYVATKQDEASTHTIDHGDELLKVGVVGFTDFTQPTVADADVEWVVVADASGDGSFVHEFRIVARILWIGRSLSVSSETIESHCFGIGVFHHTVAMYAYWQVAMHGTNN